MRAQILIYSRARGAFAGLTLKGSVVTQGKDDTRAFYGRMVPFRTILSGNLAPTDDSQPFLNALTKYGGGTIVGATPSPHTTSPEASTSGH